MTDIPNQNTRWRAPPFLRQFLAVSGVVMYMIGTGANIAYPGVLLHQLRQPGSAIHLDHHHDSWIASILGLALICGILAAPFCLQRLGRRLTNQLSTLPSLGGWALMATANGPAAILTSRFLQVASILGLALICGILAAPFCLQRLGRRLTNQLSTLPSLGGWALMATANGPAAILTSRFLQGFGMGLQAAAAPVSIAEYSSPKHRGAFLATIAFSFATGMLLAHIFGILLYWRTAALACGSFYVLSLILISLSPETPPYLASKGSYNKCRKSFHWLRGTSENSEKELEILLNSQKIKAADTNTIAGSKWKYYKEMVTKPEFYKPTVIMMFMFVLFQISGMTVVPSYTVPMMDEVTGGSIDANTSMLMVDSVRFATAILACIVVNKFSRRSILFFGVIVTVISLLMTSILLFLRDYGYIKEEYKWVPVVPTLVYIFGKTAGILPIPWAIAGEIFPLAYRSLGSGISGMFLSIMFFVVVKTAPTSFREIGVSGTFCVYAICIFICGGFLYFLLPETKGKTLYEIECHFRGMKEDVGKESREKERMLELENVEEG